MKMKGVTSREKEFTAESFNRAERNEFVDWIIFVGTSGSGISAGLLQFSIQTPVFDEEAMNILNTPRTLLQKRDHRDRKLLIRLRIVKEEGTVN